MSDCFIRNSTLRTNLKVNPIGLERARNLASNKKKNHPIRSPYEKVVGVLSQVCLCSPNLNPEHERLGLYLLLAQSDVRGLFEQHLNFSFSLIFICGLYKCSIHLQLDMVQKSMKYFCPE